jgi:hypothetical protein
VVVLGLILIILGYFLPMSILVTIGLVLLVTGVILVLLGASGHPVGGRPYWY